MSFNLIPETAPFDDEQRAWLNGFLAGWAGFIQAEAANGATAVLDGSPDAAAEEEDEEFPWHDPGLEIDERMELADGRPMKRRMMAAMAQLNCGACGYLCQTYSEAIAAGEEKNLTLCSPGGKETAKMLKKLVKEEAPSANGAAPSANGAAAAEKPSGYSRANPFAAVVKSSDNLNGEGSAKHTSHVVIDLKGSGLEYAVGDSLGVFPTNCPDLVDELLDVLGSGDDQTLRERLIQECNLREATDELLELLADAAAEPAEEAAIRGLIDSDDLDTMDVLDVVRRAPSAAVAGASVADCLTEIAPRLYSIASSPNAHPGEVHLTVGRATTTVGDRTHKGVASTMFADRIGAGDKVGVYVHASHGFTVPQDPAAPMIMVGPGTGIAPFRAFLEERRVAASPGKNWLFFGDQRVATDFLYQDEFAQMQDEGVLQKLSTAFSRDQQQKVYVQDRMREEGAELFAWLEEGGCFFVCGDAKRMAADVDRALHELIAEHGGLSEADAKGYVEKLKSEGRYARDVY